MTSGVSATNTWRATTGYWNVNAYPAGLAPGTALPDTTIWSSKVVPADTEEVKINIAGTICTLDGDAGSFTTNKVDLCGNSALTTELDIVENGIIRIGKELKVGDAGAGGAGPYGKLVQTGGDVVLNTTTNGKLEIGYKYHPTNGPGTGYYTISDGNISGTGSMYVGCYGSATGGGTTASGSVGTFTVVGTGPSISMANLFVGVSDPTVVYTGTGNLNFELNNGVSPITTTGNVYIDPNDAAVANLNVTGTVPVGDILLISNTGSNPVYGAFDNHAWGSGVTVGTTNYILTNLYNAANGNHYGGNDVALVVPEPATIALFGLGLLALVRRPRRK